MENNSLFEAIYKRCSVRKYKNEPLAHGLLKQIEELTHSMPQLDPTISMKVHLVQDGYKIQNISRGIVGSYGKISAPHYLVVTSEEKPWFMENIGFSLEYLILKLTTLNLGTCWIGGFIKKSLLKDIIEIPENHIPVIVISFGYPLNPEEFKSRNLSYNLSEEIEPDPDKYYDSTTKLVAATKRKEINEIVCGKLDETWLSIMDAVRHAPSAINSQPWRFYKEGNLFHLYGVKRLKIAQTLEHINKIDLGIALCHLVAAAQLKGKKLELKASENVERKGLNYFITVIEK
ncbi:nitroreductase family protein [Clostridium tunisiense]|uniref:nitroreductase family protein n=1 Tax=Clostridium tunisiense TaxID=219748 RepID=UPI0002FD6980|nr:nitroreductase family protein [Clostridium tunisiense]